MRKLSLDALARELLNRAKAAAHGRSAETVFGGHEQAMRQTVIALTEGTELAEHASPGEATVHVLRGRVRLDAVTASWDGRDGDLLLVPPERHSLHAVTDAVVLLSVCMARDTQPTDGRV